jgi:hypothetical protein
MSWVTLYHTTKESPVRWPDDKMPTPDRQLPAQLFATYITQQPYESGPTETSQLISYSDGTLIRLGPDGATLPDLLAGWQSLQDIYTPFFDYLTVALRATMSPQVEVPGTGAGARRLPSGQTWRRPNVAK